MREGEQSDAGRVRSKRPLAHAHTLEAVRFHEITLEIIPAALRSDGDEHAVGR